MKFQVVKRSTVSRLPLEEHQRNLEVMNSYYNSTTKLCLKNLVKLNPRKYDINRSILGLAFHQGNRYTGDRQTHQTTICAHLRMRTNVHGLEQYCLSPMLEY